MLAPLMLGAVIHTFFPANRELSGAFTGVLFAGALPVLAPVLAAWLARRQQRRPGRARTMHGTQVPGPI